MSIKLMDVYNQKGKKCFCLPEQLPHLLKAGFTQKKRIPTTKVEVEAKKSVVKKVI